MKRIALSLSLLATLSLAYSAAPASAGSAVQILRPDQVPPPPELVGAWVVSLYSPSVIRLDSGLYRMFFGVSAYCAGGSVAADSVATATSTDNLHWTYTGGGAQPSGVHVALVDAGGNPLATQRPVRLGRMER